jgi:large subunit GTPase 1
MAVAQLKNEAFDSVKENTVVLESNAFVQVRAAPSVEQLAEQKELWDRMRVPRRPRWNRDMNVDDLHEAEKEAFLEWRRTLSVVEEREHIMLTPFEKNINVWRQLWRVVELCDVLVQIVDARDPELFRCEDLERYVHEVGETKRCMLLLNKADLLTENQRRLWAEYYNQKGVRFHFFSAKTADEAANDVRERERQMRGEKDVDELSADYEEEEDDEEEQDELEDEDEDDKVTEEPKKEEEAKKEVVAKTRNDWDVLSRDMLVEMFEKLAADVKKDGERLNVGFCGYPNVGKSSTINKLMEEKKVTVSATPGKTKHFQVRKEGDFVWFYCFRCFSHSHLILSSLSCWVNVFVFLIVLVLCFPTLLQTKLP